MRYFLTACALFACAATGCATTASFVPVGPGANGGPAEHYPIPPEAPQGEVYVTSFGFTDFDLGPNQPGTMLHARLAVSNGSPQPWTVDGRRQVVVAAGYANQTPAFANSDVGTGPVYVVAPGRTAVFDFYYSVFPPLTGFALDWNVDTSAHPVANRTAFLRVDEPARSYATYPPYVTVGLGFGFGWWYGPHYPYAYHYPPVVRRYYYPPVYGHGGGWRGAHPPPTAWRGHPGPGLRATPPAAHPGWRGAPPRAPSGAWRRR
jgi:hypothetical protein